MAPRPSGREVAYCRALHKELPARLGGMERLADEPGSEFTAAWGKPSISLRCGVRKPLVLTEGYRGYDLATPTWEIDGVEWMPETQPDGSIRFTTSKREAWLEVTLPRTRVRDGGGDFAVFQELAGPVTKTIPYGLI